MYTDLLCETSILFVAATDFSLFQRGRRSRDDSEKDDQHRNEQEQ